MFPTWSPKSSGNFHSITGPANNGHTSLEETQEDANILKVINFDILTNFKVNFSIFYKIKYLDI